MAGIATGVNRLLDEFRAYFDHFEAQSYAPFLIPGQTYKTYREEARRKLAKYFMRNGMPRECRQMLDRKKTTH